MKFLVLFVLLCSVSSHADILVGLTGKYGPSGYEVSDGGSSTSSSSVTKRSWFRRKTTVTNTTVQGALDVDTTYDFVPGLMIQSVPDKKYDLSVGVAGYLDETVSVFLGIRL